MEKMGGIRGDGRVGGDGKGDPWGSAGAGEGGERGGGGGLEMGKGH